MGTWIENQRKAVEAGVIAHPFLVMLLDADAIHTEAQKQFQLAICTALHAPRELLLSESILVALYSFFRQRGDLMNKAFAGIDFASSPDYTATFEYDATEYKTETKAR